MTNSPLAQTPPREVAGPAPCASGGDPVAGRAVEGPAPCSADLLAGAPVVVIAGPTASGKSALARDLALAVDGTVINADSMQVYRDLHVVTARPSAEDEAAVPHRLYGVQPAAAACSAAQWRDWALAAIAETRRAKRLPILCGGTGLYLRALIQGLADVPEVPAPIRAEAMDRHARLGGAAFHADLAARDPAMARRLAPGDTQRMIRAWEVVRATGRSLAEWQTQPRIGPPAHLRFAVWVLEPPRPALYAACDGRFRAMVARGALDEVAALDARGLDPMLPAMKALGVPELRAHLQGRLDLDDAIARAQQTTRNYAKRQVTWFRHQLPAPGTHQVVGLRRLVGQYSESWPAEIAHIVYADR